MSNEFGSFPVIDVEGLQVNYAHLTNSAAAEKCHEFDSGRCNISGQECSLKKLRVCSQGGPVIGESAVGEEDLVYHPPAKA